MLTLEKYAGFVDKNKKIAIILMVLLVGFVVFLVWKRNRKWQPKRPKYPMSSPFGMRNGIPHNGTDYGAPENSPIEAIESGIVEVAQGGCVVGNDSCNGGNGNYVKIDHKNGYKSFYLHLTTIVVKKGDKVRKGEILGSMGNTGHSRGAHLHLAVTKKDEITKKEIFIDPETLFNS